jgi:phosphoserine aminotransferase
MADNGSMLNTPPTFRHLPCRADLQEPQGPGRPGGGGAANIAKAKRVYDAIEGSGGFYRNPVEQNAVRA